MANTKSSKKDLRRIVKRKARNLGTRSALKTFITSHHITRRTFSASLLENMKIAMLRCASSANQSRREVIRASAMSRLGGRLHTSKMQSVTAVDCSHQLRPRKNGACTTKNHSTQTKNPTVNRDRYRPHNNRGPNTSHSCVTRVRARVEPQHQKLVHPESRNGGGKPHYKQHGHACTNNKFSTNSQTKSNQNTFPRIWQMLGRETIRHKQ